MSHSITSYKVFVSSLQAWRPHWRLALLILVSLIVQQLFITFMAYVLKLIIDFAQGVDTNYSLSAILAGLAVAYLVNIIFVVRGERWTARSAGLLMGDLRRRLYAKIQEMSADFYHRMTLGDILARFTTDLDIVQAGYTQATFNTVLVLIGLVINVPIMISLDWRLGLLALCSLPLIAVVNRRIVPRASETTYQLKRSEAGIANTVQETTRAFLIVRAFGLQPQLNARFREEVDALIDQTVHSRFAIAMVGKSSSFVVTFFQIVVTIVGALLVVRGELTAGSLVGFLGIMSVVNRDVLEFAKKVMPTLVAAGSGLRRINEILEEPPAVVDVVDATDLPRLSGELRLTDVDFSYTGDTLNLRGVSLTIRQGEHVAFVGPSGSGKSTTLSLLLRLYEPQNGLITCDDISITGATQESLYRQMGVVFQENYLFNGTIRDNIRLARPEATDEQVEEAAKMAEIHDLIVGMPLGYETLVGEGGGRLSGGQRQRIAIARAMLRDPAILVLDEATSALDPATEAAINATISQLGKGRTVISVTHRLQSVVNADRIFVMRDGELVESGSHNDLLVQQGLYNDLWQKQNGFQVSEDGLEAHVEPQRLQRMPLFAALELSQLENVVDQFTSLHFGDGETIFSQGDPGDRFYLLVRGRVEVVATDSEAHERRLEVLEDGDHFGEMALLQNQPRNATIRTLAKCVLLTLNRGKFVRLVARYPEMQPAIDERMARSAANLALLHRTQPTVGD